MKHTFLIALLLMVFRTNVDAQDGVRIFGTVTNFRSNPIDSVLVILKDRNFRDLYTVRADKNGQYSMTVKKGRYHCLYAINTNHYGKTALEYWAWNVPAYNDLEINPQYDKMEVYAVNVFEPQVGPYDTYMIYFRPMSLTKSLRLADEGHKKEVERRAMANHDTIDIAPKTITSGQLTVRINDQKSTILTIQKVTEFARGLYLYGYLVQVQKPSNEPGKQDVDKITVILHSRETDEYGKADYYFTKQ
jgi:hypothetical protein